LIVAGNFKTFKTRKGTREYLEELEKLVSDSKSEVVVFPPATAIQDRIEKVEIGTQNLYPTKNGAFTGEIGLEQIEEFGIKTVLLGHSERRDILNESEDLIAQKFRFYSKEKLRIVFCVGENLEIRESGEDEVFKFLQNQLININLDYENFVIAYEPIWAIGTGFTPTLEQIETIAKKLKELTGKDVLYGGSVKPENVADILSQKSVSGVLVGGASLKADQFAKIVKIADEVSK
jgi:triosephosphate isomerase